MKPQLCVLPARRWRRRREVRGEAGMRTTQGSTRGPPHARSQSLTGGWREVVHGDGSCADTETLQSSLGGSSSSLDTVSLREKDDLTVRLASGAEEAADVARSVPLFNPVVLGAGIAQPGILRVAACICSDCWPGCRGHCVRAVVLQPLFGFLQLLAWHLETNACSFHQAACPLPLFPSVSMPRGLRFTRRVAQKPVRDNPTPEDK